MAVCLQSCHFYCTYILFFLLDYPHPISLINASAEFSNQIILNCVRICEDEHWGGAKRACLGFWLMRVTFSSTCHLQLMLLNHHPPLVERRGRNKKWHSAFFLLPLPPASLLERTKPFGDKTVQSDSNRCEKCVVIGSRRWLVFIIIISVLFL